MHVRISLVLLNCPATTAIRPGKRARRMKIVKNNEVHSRTCSPNTYSAGTSSHCHAEVFRYKKSRQTQNGA